MSEGTRLEFPFAYLMFVINVVEAFNRLTPARILGVYTAEAQIAKRNGSRIAVAVAAAEPIGFMP